MKTIVNLVDDFRPGGIRSLLDDMADAAAWPDAHWQTQIINSRRQNYLPCKHPRFDKVALPCRDINRPLSCLFIGK